MKRILTVLLSLVLACGVLIGCSSDSFKKISVTGAAQNTNYVVKSNGGSAVSYGNYIYFINGYAGYENADGKQNSWDSVVKGGLYRAELYGDSVPSTIKGAPAGALDFVSSTDSATNLEFKSGKGLDYDGNSIDVVGVNKIAPKLIGTSGYKDGGLYIFDEYVYYASPNNEKDKVGTVQTTRTDFFRSRLDGQETIKLYTTSKGVDTSAAPYMFYNQGGSVYLLVFESPKVTSVKIGTDKVEKVVTITDKATSAYFPQKDIYYKGISTNGLEDFVYYTRNAEQSDGFKRGTAIEMCRPDGSESMVVSMNGETESIEAVRDGTLFYRTKVRGDDYIKYTNLHDLLIEESPAYKEEHKSDISMFAGEINIGAFADFTATYAMRPSNDVYILCVSSSGIYMKNAANEPMIYSGEATFVRVEGNDVYFTDKDGTVYYRTNMFVAADHKTDAEKKIKLTNETKAGSLKMDICAGYIMYYGQVDEWADNYAYFQNIAAEGFEPVFVGLRSEADEKPDEDEEKKEESETPAE